MEPHLPRAGGVVPDRGAVGPFGARRVADLGDVGDEGDGVGEGADGEVVEDRLKVRGGVRGGEHDLARVEGAVAAELDEVGGEGALHMGAVEPGGGLPEGMFEGGEGGGGHWGTW